MSNIVTYIDDPRALPPKVWPITVVVDTTKNLGEETRVVVVVDILMEAEEVAEEVDMEPSRISAALST